MLQTQTVEPRTLELLRKLQSEPLMSSFNLVGGTALPDIIAMKLDAISHNGTRIKDFIDIATLSTMYSLDEMLQFYLAKYPNSNVLMPVKSLVYFDDINFEESVIMTNEAFVWDKIAQRLVDMTNNPARVYK